MPCALPDFAVRIGTQIREAFGCNQRSLADSEKLDRDQCQPFLPAGDIDLDRCQQDLDEKATVPPQALLTYFFLREMASKGINSAHIIGTYEPPCQDRVLDPAVRVVEGFDLYYNEAMPRKGRFSLIHREFIDEIFRIMGVENEEGRGSCVATLGGSEYVFDFRAQKSKRGLESKKQGAITRILAISVDKMQKAGTDASAEDAA